MFHKFFGAGRARVIDHVISESPHTPLRARGRGRIYFISILGARQVSSLHVMSRPPVLRECPACHQQRRASEFGSKLARRCVHCRRGKIGVPKPTLAATEALVEPDVEVPAPPKPPRGPPGPTQYDLDRVSGIRDASSLFDSQRVSAETALLLLGSFAFCQCCRAPHATKSVGGYTLCVVCAYQVERCGRCDTHKSAVLIPELASNEVPLVPDEISQLAV